MEWSQAPQIGQIVKVLRGRDAGKFAVIVQIDDLRFVSIVDGDKRKFDRPKKKNLLHLQLTDEISSEVVNSMADSGRVTNSKLRYVLNKYVETKLADAHEKGD